jgi:hypothetical protein
VVPLPPRPTSPGTPAAPRADPVPVASAPPPGLAGGGRDHPDTRLLPTEDELVQRVLEALQQQVELVLEFRVRELMSPVLARAADTVVREARAELARSLREMVSRAVAAELRRQRER